MPDLTDGAYALAADTQPEAHTASQHIGRTFTGHATEDECPCPQAECGLVDVQHTNPACTQHPPAAAKSIRQGHAADQCPGADTIAEATA